MFSCWKFTVILLIITTFDMKSVNNQILGKGDSRSNLVGSREIVNGIYRIIDNEISKEADDNDIIKDTPEIKTTTSVTLIFLNASYVPEASTPATQPATTEEYSSVEDKTEVPRAAIADSRAVPKMLSTVQTDYQTVSAETHQMGILDLIFPPERVLMFKSYFEALKRFLSVRF